MAEVKKPVIQMSFGIETTVSEPIIIPAEELRDGIFYYRSGIPAFTQEKLPNEYSAEINLGTAEKPESHTCKIRIYYGRWHDEDEGEQMFFPICGRSLASNGTTVSTLQHLPEGSTYTRLVIRCSGTRTAIVARPLRRRLRLII